MNFEELFLQLYSQSKIIYMRTYKPCKNFKFSECTKVIAILQQQKIFRWNMITNHKEASEKKKVEKWEEGAKGWNELCQFLLPCCYYCVDVCTNIHQQKAAYFSINLCKPFLRQNKVFQLKTFVLLQFSLIYYFVEIYNSPQVNCLKGVKIVHNGKA